MFDVGIILESPDISVNASVRVVDAGTSELARLFLMVAICCTKGPIPMDTTVIMAPMAADSLNHVSLGHN